MSFRLRLVPPARPPDTAPAVASAGLRAGGERVPAADRAEPPDPHDIDGSWRGVIQAHGGLQGGTLRAPWWTRS